jgi:hypothetical protein
MTVVRRSSWVDAFIAALVEHLHREVYYRYYQFGRVNPQGLSQAGGVVEPSCMVFPFPAIGHLACPTRLGFEVKSR